MIVDSNDVKVNGKKETIDVAPTIINDRTMIPIRVHEKLGCSIAWNSPDQRIFVSYEN